MRFANRLQFGNKTHEVSNTALRIVQRMKKDSIHSGRRPTGLCGAALLIAARMHEFGRTIIDIVRIVKIHESTLRKRLVEFAETPSSALTLDEFMSVDLEAEQDPPAFKAARKRDRERIKDIGEAELTQLQREIDIQLEKDMKKITKGRLKNICGDDTEDIDATNFISESQMECLSEYLADDPDVRDASAKAMKSNVIEGLKPDIVSMCTPSASDLQEMADGYTDEGGELDLEGLDDDEINKYILTHDEAKYKNDMWIKLNAEYLKEMKAKEIRLAKEREEGKPEKKKRQPRKKHIGPSSTPGEAIKKMLQEKKISTKINYDILRTLTAGPKGDEETVENTDVIETPPSFENVKTEVVTPKLDTASIPFMASSRSKPAYTTGQPLSKKAKLEMGLPVATETKPKEEPVIVDNDDLEDDEDIEPEPEPEKEYSSLKDMLDNGEGDDYYGYDDDY